MNRTLSLLSSSLVIACVVALSGCTALSNFDGVAADGSIGDTAFQDAAVQDAAIRDAAIRDAAIRDAALVDAEPGDVVATDAGDGDGGPELDASMDASLDAGPEVFCGRDENVRDNTCRDCAPGTFTGRNDPASGPDTMCDELCPDPPCDDACNAALGVSCATFEDAYVKASNTGIGDIFGRDVAVSGDTMVVGTRFDDSNATGVNGDALNNARPDSGAAFVFVRVDGVWSQQAYLKAHNAGEEDAFGSVVAIDGDRIVVGAPGEDSTSTGVHGGVDGEGEGDDDDRSNQGAAYIFDRVGETWEQVAYLKGPDASVAGIGLGDVWGTSVAVSGDLVAMGAPREDSVSISDPTNNSEESAGAAVIFELGAGGWTQVAYIKAPNSGRSDAFGSSLALDGGTLVVGAPAEDSITTGVSASVDPFDNGGPDSGAAYVFVFDGSGWNFQAYLKASAFIPGSRYRFGTAVDVDGERIVVGAQREGSDATGVDGAEDNTEALNSGAAYVFDRTGTTWEQVAYLKASNTEANDAFGFDVAISGDTVVVGAINEDGGSPGLGGDDGDNTAEDSAAVYIFRRIGGDWSQLAYVKAGIPEVEDRFSVVDLDGATLVIGAPGEDSNATGVGGDQTNNDVENSGAVYVRRLEFE